MNAQTTKQIEKWLFTQGVEFTFVPAVSIAEIDFKTSLKNQARLSGALINTYVERYKISLDVGDEFPPVVATMADDKYVIIDGNNRIAAARGLEWEDWPFGVYVVQNPTAAQVRNLITTANLKHGAAASDTDRLEHAIFLVDEYGLSMKDASKIVGISASRLSTQMASRIATERAKALGLRNSHKLPTKSLLELNRIELDDVFAAAVQVAVGHNLSSDAVAQLQKTIRQFRDHDEQLNAVVYEDQRLTAEDREVSDVNMAAKRTMAKIRGMNSRCRGVCIADVRTLPGEMANIARDLIREALENLQHVYKAIK